MLERLDVPPAGADSFIWADYIELRALIHPDSCFSRGDLSGIERRNRDLTGYGFKVEERWRELADFVGIRKLEFKESYPFEVSDDEDTVSFSFDGRQSQQTYLALLVASCMRNIADTRKSEIARVFEKICFEVFTKIMPAGSEIRATWANGGLEAPYVGTLYQKMQSIAQDLRCTPNFKERDFKKNDTGDGGIDLVAWHPMADERAGMPIAFAQCGCSRDDWRFKQLEASPSKHKGHLPAMHLWATYYFMPLDLRESDGDWAYKSDIGEAIIVDRLRLLRLIGQYDVYSQLPATDYVAEMLSFRYS